MAPAVPGRDLVIFRDIASHVQGAPILRPPVAKLEPSRAALWAESRLVLWGVAFRQILALKPAISGVNVGH